MGKQMLCTGTVISAMLWNHLGPRLGSYIQCIYSVHIIDFYRSDVNSDSDPHTRSFGVRSDPKRQNWTGSDNIETCFFVWQFR